MPWLLRDGRVLASVEIAASLRQRTRGLLGRDEVEGVLMLRPARSVHTIGMRFPIDVAFCAIGDDELVVLRTTTLRPHRVTRPVWKARCVLEAEAGAWERWGVTAGDRLQMRGEVDEDPPA